MKTEMVAGEASHKNQEQPDESFSEFSLEFSNSTDGESGSHGNK